MSITFKKEVMDNYNNKAKEKKFQDTRFLPKSTVRRDGNSLRR